MIIDRFIGWRLKRKPDAYLVLHGELISARMGITLYKFLQICLISAILTGFFTGIAASLLASLLYIPLYFTADTQHVFGIQVPTYEYPEQVYELIRGVPVPDQTTFSIIAFIVIFVLTTIIAYWLFLKYPGIKKSSRRTKINLSLHNAVSYMFAMRRGGAEMLEIFRSLSENAPVYGEVAIEFRQVLRDAEYFSYDLISALQHLSMTTPSEKLKDFLEDLISVISSGGNISYYLEGRVRLYQEEARFEQLQFLSTLQIIAESYVTVFVAGPLFLVIIMVVMGMVGTSAVLELSIVTYVLLPVGAAIFILFIDMMTLPEEVTERYTRVTEMKQFSDAPMEDKEDDESNYKALDWYDRLKTLRTFFKNPLEWFIMDANRSLYFTIPLAILYVVNLYLVTPLYSDMEVYYAAIDDHLIIAMLIVILPYALFFELWRRDRKSVV